MPAPDTNLEEHLNQDVERSSVHQYTDQLRTYPFRRYFARTMDAILFWLLLIGTYISFVVVALDLEPTQNILEYIIAVIDRYGFFNLIFIGFGRVLIETICLAYFGTTPGKWLLGISVSNQEGNNPPMKQSFGRSVSVWIIGLGLYLPILTLFTTLIAFFKLISQKITYWDKTYGTRVHVLPMGSLGWLRIALLLTLPLLFWLALIQLYLHGSAFNLIYEEILNYRS